MSVDTNVDRHLDRLSSAPSAVFIGLALEVEPEGTSAYCQLQYHSGRWSCVYCIPPHGESSASIGTRILGMSVLMSKLKSVSVEHRGVGTSWAFPMCGRAGISSSPFSCVFSLILRSMMDTDESAH